MLEHWTSPFGAGPSEAGRGTPVWTRGFGGSGGAGLAGQTGQVGTERVRAGLAGTIHLVSGLGCSGIGLVILKGRYFL